VPYSIRISKFCIVVLVLNMDVSLADEFTHIQEWAVKNGMIISMDKTKELVLHRPHPRKWSLLSL